MTNQTKPTYSEMKESFNHVSAVLSETQLMETLKGFKSEAKAKQWLISHLNDRQRYFVSMVDAFTTKGWKHFYGQPLYLKFLELYAKNILFLVDCSPLSARETKTFKEQIVDLLASCQGVSEAPKPKVSPRKPKASKPKVSQSKPKVVASKPTVSKPKVSDDKLTKLTESVCLLAKQVAQLTELVTRTSLEVAEIKASKVEPKVVQPKVVSKPKVIDEKVLVRDKKTNTKVVVSKEIKPKATPTKSLWEQIFTQTTKVDHKLAFGHSSDVDCGKRKKALMEVK